MAPGTEFVLCCSRNYLWIDLFTLTQEITQPYVGKYVYIGNGKQFTKPLTLKENCSSTFQEPFFKKVHEWLAYSTLDIKYK